MSAPDSNNGGTDQGTGYAPEAPVGAPAGLLTTQQSQPRDTFIHPSQFWQNMYPEEPLVAHYDVAAHAYSPRLDEVFQTPDGTVLPSQLPRTESEYAPSVGAQEWSGSPIIEPDTNELSESFTHVPTGTSVIAKDAVQGDDGRTYHGYKEGKYFLPNDPKEQDRLDFQHQASLLQYGGLTTAPISKPFTGTVLDIATGTGIWALDFAEQNPEATVIGTDLSAIQPSRPGVNNCTFVKEDAEEHEWLLGPSTDQKILFDYVHARLVYTCFNSHLKVFQNIYNNLKPGGWVEYQDFDPLATSPDGTHIGSATALLFDVVRAAGSALGRDFRIACKYKDLMAQVGFIDIEEKREYMPIGGWPADRHYKEIGLYMRVDGAMGLLSTTKLLRAIMPPDQVKWLQKLTQQELLHFHRDVHVMFTSVIVRGRKPFDWETQQPKRAKRDPESGGKGHEEKEVDIKTKEPVTKT